MVAHWLSTAVHISVRAFPASPFGFVHGRIRFAEKLFNGSRFQNRNMALRLWKGRGFEFPRNQQNRRRHFSEGHSPVPQVRKHQDCGRCRSQIHLRQDGPQNLPGKTFPYAISKADEGLVSGLVPVSVVDKFKIVQVKIKQVLQFFIVFNYFEKAMPAGKARERVQIGSLPYFALPSPFSAVTSINACTMPIGWSKLSVSGISRKLDQQVPITMRIAEGIADKSRPHPQMPSLAMHCRLRLSDRRRGIR